MITYEEALEIARQYRDDLAICTETTNAYIFDDDSEEVRYGGFQSPVVIMKEDGATKAMSWYMMNCPGEDIRAFRI